MKNKINIYNYKTSINKVVVCSKMYKYYYCVEIENMRSFRLAVRAALLTGWCYPPRLVV